LPTDTSQKGPWVDVKDDDVRKRFLEHCKQSPYPEEFSGIRTDVRPPSENNPRIVYRGISANPAKRGKLSTDSSKRNDCWVPCSICATRKFFLTGDLIRDDEGWLYIVGGECGEKHFGHRYIKELERFERQEQERRAQDYLLDVYASVPAWRKTNNKLQPIALKAARAQERLSKLPTFVAEVRRAMTKDGGMLKVRGWQVRRLKDGTQSREPVMEEFARVTGAAAVSIKSNFLFRLDQASKVLAEFGRTQDAAFARIDKASREGQLPELAAALRGAISETHAIRTELAQCRAFFQEANLKTLRSWTRNRNCPVRVHIETEGTIWTFRTSERGTPRRINIASFTALVPKVPQ
jgi:hypothetical protein